MAAQKALSPWNYRIDSANRFYNTWKNLFRCEVLEKYYEGFQWNTRIVGYQPYVLNLIYSTIKLKMGNMIYQRPRFQVDPVPQFSDWNLEFAVNNAYIKQDALNTIISNKNVDFKHNVKLAALDSYFRFGIIETGYAADWKNPLYIPKITDSNDKVINRDVSNNPIPVNERVFFKHIRASRFRVSANDATTLKQAGWCGYYEYRYKSDLANTKGIRLPKQYKARYSALDYGDISSYLNVENKSPEMWATISRGEVLKVWHIWDNFTKQYCMWLDNAYDEPLYDDVYEELPFSEVRWDLRAPSLENSNSTSWYPIPPVFQWISSQDEINRTREQLRNYRRRFTRKWGYLKGKVEPTELEKLKTEEDGLAIEMKQADAIFAISNPEIGISIQTALSVDMTDMNLISGTSSESRADADRQTATQSKIINARQQIRESVEQLEFSEFVCDIGKQALTVMKERFSEGMWVKLSQDPGGADDQPFAEYKAKALNYKYVTAQQIDDGYDEEISLNVEDASPEIMEAEKMKFVTFLQLLMQYPPVAMDPVLIRETAYKVGYRNERVIRRLQQMALLHMAAQAAQMQSSFMGQPSNNGPFAIAANNQSRQQANAGPTPQDQINQQLANQFS